MIIVSVPKKELQDASKIANSLNLLDIKLRQANVSEENIDVFFNNDDKTTTNVNVDYKSGKRSLVEGQTLTALVGTTVTIDKGAAKIVYSVQYDVIYKLPTSTIPKEVTPEMFDAFSKHNGLLNCWPYIRALISNLSSEVGFPVVLPLLKIQAKTDEVDKTNQ